MYIDFTEPTGYPVYAGFRARLNLYNELPVFKSPYFCTLASPWFINDALRV